MNLDSIKTIGIFRALQLGDLLCSIPAVRALRAAAPHAHITLIGLPWQHHFARRFNHYFNSFIPFAGWPGLPELPVEAKSVAAFLQQVRTKNFDLLLQLHGDGSISNNMCMLWNAKYVAGLRKAGGYCPNEKTFPILQEGEHEITRYVHLMEALGIPSQGAHLEFPFSDEDIEDYLELTKHFQLEPQQYICLHPGARDQRRRWPLERFARVGDSLAKRGFTIVLTGSSGERDLLEELERKMEVPVINPVATLGDFSLGALALTIKNTALLVCNDTGVSHIASALQVPSVVIFSSYSELSRWAPLNPSMHKTIPGEMVGDTHAVITAALDHLEVTSNPDRSSLLFN